MYFCDSCDKWFRTENGYGQHLRTSAAHQYRYESSSSEEEEVDDPYQWECTVCDRYFGSENARHQHYSNSSNHSYCVPCKRMFMNFNNLNQHLHSKIHCSMNCPWCKESFATASAVTIHLESGRCNSSGLNRQKINNLVQQLDRNNVITRPMLTMPGYDDESETIATSRTWNGRAYECYFCTRECATLRSLDQHLQSPAHDESIYRCPNVGCRKPYKVLSGLVQHIESESCGFMRFGQVQQQASRGIQNMIGRMIQ